jgi:hypothetical protein
METQTPSSTSSTPSSGFVRWSAHTFCTYTICRATLPVREGFHDIATHFTDLPLKAVRPATRRKSKARTKEPERKSSAIVFTGRDEWMDGYADTEQAAEEMDDELVGMERLTPILSEE